MIRVYRPGTPAARAVALPADTYDQARGIDWIAVERTADGTYDHNLLTRAEKKAAALLMVSRGYTRRTVWERMHVDGAQLADWKREAFERNAFAKPDSEMRRAAA